ncbi:hypothetical protein MTO96_044678, partial [Rhipicephalus appendiculatus]
SPDSCGLAASNPNGENVMKASLVNGLAVIVATVLVASFVAPSQALGSIYGATHGGRNLEPAE